MYAAITSVASKGSLNLTFSTSFLNVVKDIDYVDIVEPCDFPSILMMRDVGMACLS